MIEDDRVVGEALISRRLQQFNESPLIGLEYVAEIWRPPKQPVYHCFLCECSVQCVVSDVVSAEHRLAYLKRFFPRAFVKFADFPNLSLWDRSTFDILEDVIARIEARHGRQCVTVVKSMDDFVTNELAIMQAIEEGSHIRQSSDFDFAWLQDPFASYRDSLLLAISPKHGRVDTSQSEGPEAVTQSQLTPSMGLHIGNQNEFEKDANWCVNANQDRWTQFHEAFRVFKSELQYQKEIYDKRPEFHPAYPKEWQLFWQTRCDQLLTEGKDPELHDFKREWVPYWTKRVHELYQQELQCRQDELLERFNLKAPEGDNYRRLSLDGGMNKQSNPSHQFGSCSTNRRSNASGSFSSPAVNVASCGVANGEPEPGSSRGHGQVTAAEQFLANPSGFSDAGDRTKAEEWSSNYTLDPQLLMSPDASQPLFSGLMDCLRLLTALEDCLGSLGPQINALMSKALQLEKSHVGASSGLLQDAEVLCVLETTKEKLLGHLYAGVLSPAMLSAMRRTLDKLTNLLTLAAHQMPPAPCQPKPANSESSASQAKPCAVQPEENPLKIKLKHILADLLSKELVQSGLADIGQHELHKLVFAIAQYTDLDDGSLMSPPASPSTVTSSSWTSNASSTANPDSLDELTSDELHSLLDNFQHLSQPEQVNLIKYMKKLGHMKTRTVCTSSS